MCERRHAFSLHVCGAHKEALSNLCFCLSAAGEDAAREGVEERERERERWLWVIKWINLMGFAPHHQRQCTFHSIASQVNLKELYL